MQISAQNYYFFLKYANFFGTFSFFLYFCIDFFNETICKFVN